MGGEGGGWQSVLPKIRDKLRTAFLVAVLHSSSVQRAAALLGRVLGGPGVWGWGWEGRHTIGGRKIAQRYAFRSATIAEISGVKSRGLSFRRETIFGFCMKSLTFYIEIKFSHNSLSLPHTDTIALVAGMA